MAPKEYKKPCPVSGMLFFRERYGAEDCDVEI
jgi:hypothetical protein